MPGLLGVFTDWFGQGASFPAIAVDVVFFLSGAWMMLLRWKRARTAVLLCVALLAASLVLQFLPNVPLNLLAVLLCGFSTMMLAGMAVMWCACQVIFLIRKKREEKDVK